MGKLYVTGIGPGNEKGMTLRAREVLEECTIIVGYKTYIDLIRPLFDTEYAKEGCEEESSTEESREEKSNAEESSTEKNGTGTGRAEERSRGMPQWQNIRSDERMARSQGDAHPK